MWVSGDVIAPLLGFDAAPGARARVADSHRWGRGCESRGGLRRRVAGQELHSAGAPAQRQRGSSREGVHAAGHTDKTHCGSNCRLARVTSQGESRGKGEGQGKGKGERSCDLKQAAMPGIDWLCLTRGKQPAATTSDCTWVALLSVELREEIALIFAEEYEKCN